MTLRAVRLLIACLFLAACGSAPPRANPLLEQAERLRNDGGRAFANRDYDSAARNFAAAAQLRASLDDAPGTALDRLNLARALYAARDTAAAQAPLDAVLTQAGVPGALRAEAARQRAVLALAAGRSEEAQRWQQRAANDCAQDCPLAASLALIRAQIALRQNDLASAGSEAAVAQKLLGEGNPAGAEHANAARLTGEIAVLRKDWSEARRAFEQALEVDRKLGSAERVRLDLRLLAAADEASADLPAARGHYQRLLQAAEAGGDAEAAALAAAALQRLSRAAASMPGK